MPPGETYTVQKRSPERGKILVSRLGVGTGPGIIWTDEGEHVILQVIHDTINNAEADLLASTFSLSGMSGRPDLLIEPLHAATERGVRVRLLVRSRNNVAGHRRDAQALADMGVEIYADSLNHAKGVIADGRRGALFSANFDAEHGLVSGVEVGTCLTGLPAVSEATRYFDHAIRHADLEFLVGPTQEQLNRRLGARWRTPWPFGETMCVNVARTSEWESFRSVLQSGPVLFSKQEDQSVVLYAGQQRWQVTELSGRGASRLVREERPQTYTFSPARREQRAELSDSLVNSGREFNRPVRLGLMSDFEPSPHHRVDEGGGRNKPATANANGWTIVT